MFDFFIPSMVSTLIVNSFEFSAPLTTALRRVSMPVVAVFVFVHA